MYPPGQFAAWNPAGARPAQREPGRSWYGASEPDAQAYDPGYSALAVSEPSADVTSTQTWEKIPGLPVGDDSGTWTSPRGPAGAGIAGAGIAGAGTAMAGAAGAPPAAGLGGPGPGSPGSPGSPAGPRAAAAGPASAMPGVTRADGPVPGGAIPGSTIPGATIPGSVIPGTAGPAGAGPGSTGPGTATMPASRSHAARPPGSRTAARAGKSRGGRPPGTGSRPPGKAKRSPSVVLAVCAVLVLALAAGAFLFFTARHQSTPATAAPPPSTAPASSASPSASPTLGPLGHIATRKADPLPLTITQLYPRTFSATGIAFTRTISKAGKTCSTAIVGSTLQSAVKAAKCSQVVRASYLAASKKEMGTIGVLNLSTSKGAEHAGRAAGATNFILQLKARKGATHTLGKGTGIEEAAAKGHYLILIWAQFTSHRKPKTKGQRKELANFMHDLFLKTANVSLSNRLVTGTP